MFSISMTRNAGLFLKCCSSQLWNHLFLYNEQTSTDQLVILLLQDALKYLLLIFYLTLFPLTRISAAQIPANAVASLGKMLNPPKNGHS